MHCGSKKFSAPDPGLEPAPSQPLRALSICFASPARDPARRRPSPVRTFAFGREVHYLLVKLLHDARFDSRLRFGHMPATLLRKSSFP